MTQKTLLWLLLSGLLLSTHLSCAEADGTLEIYLVQSPLSEEDPLDTNLVNYIRIRIAGEDMRTVEDVFEFEPGGSATLSKIPVGNNRIITVEGLGEAENEYAVSRGRSLPMKIREGHQEIELFIARVGRFSFAPGDGLMEARFAHTAAVSRQGALFMIGGASAGSIDNPVSPLSSVEVYDPTSGKTKPYSCAEEKNHSLCLNLPRSGAAAALIEDGILVVGGLDPNGGLDTIEKIDTRRMTSEDFGFSTVTSSDAAVVPLENATLIAGGRDAEGHPVDAAELIDVNGTIEVLGLPNPRSAMAAAKSNSEGFLFGGFDENGAITSDFFLFDIQTNTFSGHDTEITGRAWASAASISDGRVLVIGGLTEEGQASASIDLYDPDQNLLCHFGELRLGRWLASVVELSDGKILVMGGLVGNSPGEPTTNVEMIDPRFLTLDEECGQTSGTNVSSPVPDLRIPRYGSSAVLLPNGAVAVTGGLNQDDNPIEKIEIFITVE
ncbi:MAG: hypothetical protein GY762_21890 [Proteobacteria bacterium]|nr:hypothetical protein [Pseudomonadota bacterium]